MEFEDIIYEKRNHMAWVTINRPERLNAFDFKTMSELGAAFEDVGLDGKIGVVVLTGAGDRAFSAGGYLGELASFNIEKARLLFSNTLKTFTIMRQIPQPIIAAVNGYALGGGNELVIVCDLAIASERARFGQRLGAPGILISYSIALPCLVGLTHFLTTRHLPERAKHLAAYMCREDCSPSQRE